MKRIWMLLMAIVLTTFFAGFAFAQELPEIPLKLPDQIAGGAPVSITVAACIGEDQQGQRDEFDAQLARFMEAYPNVTVTRVQYCFSPESFAAMVAGNSVPTVFGVPATMLKRMMDEGIAADLSAPFETMGLGGVYNPTLMALISKDGHPHGFPEFSYAQGLVWDIAALKAAGYDLPPANWADFAKAAHAASKPGEGVAGFAMNLTGGGGGWNFTNLAYGFGATELIAENEDGTYTAVYGEGPAVEAMQYLYDLRWPEADNALPLDISASPTQELLDGRAVMEMSPADGSVGWIRVNSPETDLNRFGYGTLPAAPDGKFYTLTGGSYQMIFAGASPEEQEAAVVFQVWRTLSPGEFAPSRTIFHNTQAGAGAPVLPTFAGELQAAVDAYDLQFVKLPVENYKPFYDVLNSGNLVLVPEPPFAQDFYTAIAEVMTTVLTDENADVPALMADSAKAFQAGILDPAAPK